MKAFVKTAIWVIAKLLLPRLPAAVCMSRKKLRKTIKSRYRLYVWKDKLRESRRIKGR